MAAVSQLDASYRHWKKQDTLDGLNTSCPCPTLTLPSGGSELQPAVCAGLKLAYNVSADKRVTQSTDMSFTV